MKSRSSDPERRAALRLQALRSMYRKLSPFAVLVVAFGLGAILDACDQRANAEPRPHAMVQAPSIHRLPPAVRKQIGDRAR